VLGDALGAPERYRSGMRLSLLLSLVSCAGLHPIEPLLPPSESRDTVVSDLGSRVEGAVVIDAAPSEVVAALLTFNRWMVGLGDIYAVVELPGKLVDGVRLLPDGIEVQGAIEPIDIAVFSNRFLEPVVMRVRVLPERVVWGTVVMGPPLMHGAFAFWLDELDQGRRTRVRACFQIGALGSLSDVVAVLKPIRDLRQDLGRLIATLPAVVREASGTAVSAAAPPGP